MIRKENLVPIPCGIPYTFGVVGTPEKNLIPADDIATFQTGTHPALTASPIAYQLVNAAEIAIAAMKSEME